MIEGLQLSIPHRMSLLRNTIVVALIISMCLSFRLWIETSPFPANVLISETGQSVLVNSSLFGVLFLLLLGSMVLVKQRLLLLLAQLICIAFCLMDINRIQPWFYIYNLMLFVFLFYNGRVDDSSKYTTFFILLQIIVASVYFFSGWHQLNDNFIETDFQETISSLKGILSERHFNFFKKAGQVVPYILMFIGLGLMIAPIRYLAISMAVVFHVLLVLLLFPGTSHLDYSLWFSNFAFIPMVLLLFSGKTKQRYYSPLFLFQKPLFYFIIILFVLMPFFNNSNYWPDYLSANFKSGNNRSVMISASTQTAEHLPAELKKYCEPHYGFMVFNYDRWYLEEKHVKVFPSNLVFKSMYNYLKNSCEGDVKEIELQVIRKQKILLKP